MVTKIRPFGASISGGGDPYNDTVELGFLAAVEAGIYVAASVAGQKRNQFSHLLTSSCP